MDHVAIMKKSWGLIPKILSGEKTIESRWYQTKRAPWDRVRVGEKIFFKNAGEPVTAQARVSEVIQVELQSLADASRVVKQYGKEICPINPFPETWGVLPRYCILMRLEQPQAIAHPFSINKTGFGNAAAWLCVERVEDVRG